MVFLRNAKFIDLIILRFFRKSKELLRESCNFKSYRVYMMLPSIFIKSQIFLRTR